MFFNILSIVFGLISLGMLSPFLDILFNTGKPGSKGAVTLQSNAIGGLKEIFSHVAQSLRQIHLAHRDLRS